MQERQAEARAIRLFDGREFCLGCLNLMRAQAVTWSRILVVVRELALPFVPLPSLIGLGTARLRFCEDTLIGFSCRKLVHLSHPTDQTRAKCAHRTIDYQVRSFWYWRLLLVRGYSTMCLAFCLYYMATRPVSTAHTLLIYAN